jgi:hypothetical protein
LGAIPLLYAALYPHLAGQGGVHLESACLIVLLVYREARPRHRPLDERGPVDRGLGRHTLKPLAHGEGPRHHLGQPLVYHLGQHSECLSVA